MELNKWDMVMIVTMSLSIILMSFVFPQLGMTADGTAVENESNVPELRMENSTFDFAQGIPNTGVNSPTQGTMIYDDRGGGIEGYNMFWIDRPKQSGTSIQLVNSTATDGDLEIWFRDWNDTGSVIASDEYDVPEEGETVIHNNASWTIEFEVMEHSGQGTENLSAEVDYTVRDTPDGSGGGFNFDGLGDLAQVLSYIAVVITWGVMTVMEFAINVVVIIFEVTVFLVDLLTWLGQTYFTVIDGASGWASIVLLVPGIILSLEFGKLGLIVVSLLPTT